MNEEIVHGIGKRKQSKNDNEEYNKINRVISDKCITERRTLAKSAV